MKGIAAAGVIFLMAGRLFAQQQEDPVERDVQRLKDRLNLTDDQISKAREIVKKEHEDLKGILTDEQKKTYDQGGRGGPPPGRGNTQAFGTRSAWYPSTDELKKDLSLTDDQVTKINAVRDGVREEMRRFFQGRRGGGGTQDFQAAMDKMRDEATGRIRDVLTDEQKPKFDEIVKTYRAQQDQGGRGTLGRGGGSVDDRVKSAMDALKVDKAEEAEAIKGVVKKVLELMDKLSAYQRDARGKFDEIMRNTELSDKALGDKIEEIQKPQADIEKDLKTARKELADIVTNRQELELLRRGILR
jgi:Spy/CpxP family protein refolding chaperone